MGDVAVWNGRDHQNAVPIHNLPNGVDLQDPATMKQLLKYSHGNLRIVTANTQIFNGDNVRVLAPGRNLSLPANDPDIPYQIVRIEQHLSGVDLLSLEDSNVNAATTRITPAAGDTIDNWPTIIVRWYVLYDSEPFYLFRLTGQTVWYVIGSDCFAYDPRWQTPTLLNGCTSQSTNYTVQYRLGRDGVTKFRGRLVPVGLHEFNYLAVFNVPANYATPKFLSKDVSSVATTGGCGPQVTIYASNVGGGISMRSKLPATVSYIYMDQYTLDTIRAH